MAKRHCFQKQEAGGEAAGTGVWYGKDWRIFRRGI